jgi:beta-lactam-binding protein with PASTA domain
VTVYTSDGSQATVPDVGGKSVGGARSTLSNAGFGNVGVSEQFAKGDGKNECRVASSDPGPGTNASKDTGITLQLFGNKDGKPGKGCK